MNWQKLSDSDLHKIMGDATPGSINHTGADSEVRRRERQTQNNMARWAFWAVVAAACAIAASVLIAVFD